MGEAELQAHIDAEVAAGTQALHDLISEGLDGTEIAELTLLMAGVKPEDFPKLCHEDI